MSDLPETMFRTRDFDGCLDEPLTPVMMRPIDEDAEDKWYASAPPTPLRASETAWVASPPQTCLNGCHSGSGDARRPVETEGPALICRSCSKRVDSWLRALPDLFTLLPSVIDHGTVAGNPGNVHAKNPDPPAPMRLEVLDMLDTRHGLRSDGTTDVRGVLGLLHSWAERVRDERHLARPDRATVSTEISTLLGHLAWITQQDWVEDLYAEIKTLHRQLRDAVGEYRQRPVGTCHAQPIGAEETAVCGGPLFMDRDGHAVECSRCGNRQEADHGLRELGLKIGLIDENGYTTGSRRAAS